MDAIITAAGKNSRMINDFIEMDKTPIHKLKLEINNKPLLVHTIENVLNSDVENVIICLGHYKDEIYEVLDHYSLVDKVNIVINNNPEVGLTKTISNALEENMDNFYLFAAADQPTLTSKTINDMINTLENSSNPKNTISIFLTKNARKSTKSIFIGVYGFLFI